MMQDNPLQFKIKDEPCAVLSLSYERSLEALCGHFTAEVIVLDESIKGLCGSSVEITLSGQTIFYCTLEGVEYEPKTALHIAGRDVISVLVDSTAEPLEFLGTRDLRDIAATLCEPFKISAQTDLEKILVKNWVVERGDTVHETLEKAAKKAGVFLGTKTGKELVLRKPQRVDAFKIDQESPLKSIRLRQDISEIFDFYESKLGSFCSEIKNSKKKIFYSKKDVKEEHRARKNKSVTVHMVLAGIFKLNPGDPVKILLLDKGLDGEYFVQSITYSLGSSGTETEVILNVLS